MYQAVPNLAHAGRSLSPALRTFLILPLLILAGLGSCLPARASLSISSAYLSPRNSQRPLRKSTRFIILHTTEGGARGSLEKLRANGECHYVVDRNGRAYRIIDRRRIAFHAGRSMWNGVTDLDSCSIGIEIVGYHNKEFTKAQYDTLRKILADLKRIYKVPDQRVLTHSMVAYGVPNRWQKRSHRGRKRCCMLMADPARRRRVGLFSKPSYDPDLRAGRLVDADPELTRILYGRSTGKAVKQDTTRTGSAKQPQLAQPDREVIGAGRSAWDIARDLYNAETTVYTFPDGTRKNGREIKNWKTIPAGTRVSVGQTVQENPHERLLTLGKDGKTARELAGDEANAATTYYFRPGKKFISGARITAKELQTLPDGTRVLVGYRVGGPVDAGRPAFAVCGVRWNRPDTWYLMPNGNIVSGNTIDEKGIHCGAMVFYRQ